MKKMLIGLALLAANSLFALTDAEVDRVTRLYNTGKYSDCFVEMAKLGSEAMATNPRFLCLQADISRYGLHDGRVNLKWAKQCYGYAARRGEPAALVALLQLNEIEPAKAKVMYDNAYKGLMLKFAKGDEYSGVQLAELLLDSPNRKQEKQFITKTLKQYVPTNPMAEAILNRMRLEDDSTSDVTFSPFLIGYLEGVIESGKAKLPLYTIVGNCYHLGKGVDKDMAKAIKYYQLGADKGERVAQLFIAQLYEEGLVPGVDERKSNAYARRWYKKAAENGNSTAQWRLVNIYLRPELGAAHDIEEVKKWLTELTKKGDEQAEIVLNKILRKEAERGY